jgi:hypothetical protein
LTYGSGISDGNKHNHDDLPVLLAGGSSMFQTGRHIRYTQSSPVSSLYLSVLDAAGVPTDKFADSQGKLDYLTSLT